ncbi:PhzF family phenazine biosynthesis protein [Leifsonia naganoensis]|uniref:PhzF family phenazine biosynthesis protein n=1 Tax=Leifsonia naganoensis TaxID=150025 RepID=A0A853DT74_9MICO|nr:PhzF family phenazine biosynthesis protein [Leifsonia naganoensis]NYK10649.1 PhzF family phenazine biosynthesis protein [Leifsonia naganoensis]
MDVPFVWIDVFAERALAGNPLPLVPDADALSDEQLRAIAREFNQSETTFLCRPTAPEADARLRSLTPAGVEVGGAGHNAMGAWIWLAGSGRLDPGRDAFVQQIGDDLLPVRVSSADGIVRVTMEQSRPRFPGRFADREALAASLGLPVDGLAAGRRPEVGDTGAEHLLVPATTREAVDAAVPDQAALKAVLAGAGAEGCYLYTAAVDPSSGTHAYARFFNPTVGIAEDPATGTAAGPLAALLVRDGLAAAGAPVVIEQGRSLGRPSRIVVTVDGDRVALTGSGVVAAAGTLFL